jgi:hypothetical protein
MQTCASTTPNLDKLKKLTFEQLCELDTDPKCGDVTYAREILDKGGFYARDAPVTPLTIATLLMTFVAFNEGRTLVKNTQTILRSMAVVLANEDTTTVASLVALKVLDMAEGMLEEVRKATKQLDSAMSTMLQTTDDAHAATERMARQAEELFGDQGRMMDIAENAEATLSTLQEHTGRLEDRLGNLPITPTPTHLSPDAWPRLPSPPLPTPPPEIMVRHTAAERNIVFDLNPAAAADAKELSEDELVRRANVAVDKMSATTKEKPREVVFAAATKLAHGGI